MDRYASARKFGFKDVPDRCLRGIWYCETTIELGFNLTDTRRWEADGYPANRDGTFVPLSKEVREERVCGQHMDCDPATGNKQISTRTVATCSRNLSSRGFGLSRWTPRGSSRRGGGLLIGKPAAVTAASILGFGTRSAGTTKTSGNCELLVFSHALPIVVLVLAPAQVAAKI